MLGDFAVSRCRLSFDSESISRRLLRFTSLHVHDWPIFVQDSLQPIRIRLFAQAKELAQQEELCVEGHAGMTIAELKSKLIDEFPNMNTLLPHCLFAVNEQYATADTTIGSADRIACFPPVSGG